MFKKLFGIGGSDSGAAAKKAPGARVQRKGSGPSAPPTAPLVPPMPDFSSQTPATMPRAEAEPSQAEVRALLRDALAEAERELDDRKDRDRRDPSGAKKRQDKQSLITAAMAVRRMKQTVLDDLDPQTRTKLKKFAEASMGVGGGPKKRS